MKTQIITSMLALSMLTAGSLSARADDTSANKPLPVNQQTTAQTTTPQTTASETKMVKKVQKKRKSKLPAVKSGTPAATTDQGISEKKAN
jgi:hypothetical protein